MDDTKLQAILAKHNKWVLMGRLQEAGADIHSPVLVVTWEDVIKDLEMEGINTETLLEKSQEQLYDFVCAVDKALHGEGMPRQEVVKISWDDVFGFEQSAEEEDAEDFYDIQAYGEKHAD